MRIRILGSGRIGGNAGKLFARAGHEVLLQLLQGPREAGDVGEEAGNGARSGTPEEAARFGEVVMLSVPWALVGEALEAAGSLDGQDSRSTPPTRSGETRAGNFGVLELPGGLSRRRVQRPPGGGLKARQGVQHHDLGLPGRSRRKNWRLTAL